MRNISMKVNITIGLLLVTLATLLMAACDLPRETVTPATIPTSGATSINSTLATDNPYSAYFHLSQAPRLGETAELTFEIKNIRQLDSRYQSQDGLSKSKAWVDFYWTNIHGSYTEAVTPVRIPLDEVVVSGATSWEGNFNKNQFNLHSIIRLPREGIWRIQWNFTGEGWSRNFDGNYWVAVADGTAAIMNTNTEEFKSGPLAYLAFSTFPGGNGSQRIPTPDDPYSVYLDILKAPKVGEEVKLICRILSLNDMTDFSIQWHFYKRTGDNVREIPSTSFLTGADLGWKNDIKKGEPVVFSTTIKFPSEGEWAIMAIANSEAINNMGTASNGDDLQITITSARSYFGWAKLPWPTDSGTTVTRPAQT
jgi:hypothetical protein